MKVYLENKKIKKSRSYDKNQSFLFDLDKQINDNIIQFELSDSLVINLSDFLTLDFIPIGDLPKVEYLEYFFKYLNDVKLLADLKKDLISDLMNEILFDINADIRKELKKEIKEVQKIIKMLK